MKAASQIQRSNKKPTLLSNVNEVSDVTQESEQDIQAQAAQQQEEQLGWKALHKQKWQIQKIMRQLLPMYVSYRKNLSETIREYCVESNIQHFDYTPYLLAQTEIQKHEELHVEVKQSNVQQKIAMVEKVINERRIKRYYKNKHQINFQDELDPQDDQKQIYRFYQEAFGSYSIKAPEMHEYNEQITTQKNNIKIPQSNQASPRENKTEQYQVNYNGNYNYDDKIMHYKDINQSKDNLKYKDNIRYNQYNEAYHQPIKKSATIANINYLKVSDPFVGFEQDLSFDFKNQHHFVINNQHPDSFAVNEDSLNNDAISEGGRFQKKSQSKQIDNLSHKDNLYKNFIQKQNEQLQKQKMRVQQLTDKAFKVLNNDDIEDQEIPTQQPTEEDEKISQLKYIFGELIELYSLAQCLKFHLKFKSYELINKLYEHASQYYQEEIHFSEPLNVKQITQIIAAALPEEQEQGIRIIILNIFGQLSQLSYEQFLESLTPSINDHQFKLLQEALVDKHTLKSLDLAIELFNIWVEIDYFQKQVKSMLDNNSQITDKFIFQVAQNGAFSSALICDFIYKNKKTKVKKSKIQIFFRSIIGQKMNVSQFYRWIDSKTNPVNQSFQKHKEQEKYEYYYNLY